MTAHRHYKRHHALAEVHGASRIGQFNAGLGVYITNHVGTMWTAYLFAVIGATGIVGALTNSVTVVLLVGAVSGYFLQLVLLPVIIVGQNVNQAAQDGRAAADHETLAFLAKLQDEQMLELKQQTEILQALKALNRSAK